MKNTHTAVVDSCARVLPFFLPVDIQTTRVPVARGDSSILKAKETKTLCVTTAVTYDTDATALHIDFFFFFFFYIDIQQYISD